MLITKQTVQVVFHVDAYTCIEQAVEQGHDIDDSVTIEIPILNLPRFIRRLFQVDGIYRKVILGLTDGTTCKPFTTASRPPTETEAIDTIGSCFDKFDAGVRDKVTAY